MSVCVYAIVFVCSDYTPAVGCMWKVITDEVAQQYNTKRINRGWWIAIIIFNILMSAQKK